MSDIHQSLHLALPLTGFCAPVETFHRRVLFEQLLDLLPQEPEAHVTVYTAEIAPGGKTDWHVHHGLVLFLVLHGSITVEFRDHTVTYHAGDVYWEPLDIVHRGTNPHPTASFVCVCFTVTAPDRPPVTSINSQLQKQ